LSTEASQLYHISWPGFCRQGSIAATIAEWERQIMPPDCLMGIDIGTQSTRVAVLDTAGHVVASSGTPLEMQVPRPGWAEQDPQHWWESTVGNIRKVLARAKVRPERILAIGTGGQMHGCVPVGTHGELLSHEVQLWCDKRAAGLVDRFAARPEAPAACRLGANPPVPNWWGFKILWLKNDRPELYRQTSRFVFPKDFINLRLTGEVATDYSEASGSFLMDAERCAWSAELAEMVGVDPAKLPDLHASSAVIGRVTPEAAALTGLAEGTPVVAGGGDMLCMLLAAGITRPGRVSDQTGTSAILSAFTPSPVIDARLMNLHHVLPGWITFGITDSGGVSLKWFRDAFCGAEKAEAASTGVEAYALLGAQAATVEPGAEGLLYFPYLMGERTLGTPYARGVLFGLTPRTGKGAVVRAIMEGVTFELRRALEIVEAAGHPVEAIFHSGGGARSDVWSQIKADIYGRKVMTFESGEGTILGSAILAGVGAGLFPDPASGAESCLRVAKVFEPRPEWKPRYDALFEVFEKVHDALQGPFRNLADVP
jgi:xylulokinase